MDNFKTKKPIFLRLWAHLEKKWKVKFSALVVLMCFSGFSEMVTLGSVVPFLAAIIDPEAALQFSYFQGLYVLFGINNENLVSFLSIVFCSAVVISAILRLSIARLNLVWTHLLIADLAIDVYTKTLYQGYEVHSSRNSSEIVSGITQKIPVLLSGVFLPIVSSIQYLILSVSIVFALILVLPLSNIIALGLFALAYALFSFFLKKKLNLNSQIISIQHVGAIKVLQESLLNIRSIILGNYYKFYLDKYASYRTSTEQAAGENGFISHLPKYIIEAAAILLIVALASFSLPLEGGAASILPSLGLLALGAQRLMPCLQGLYVAFTSIQGGYESANDSIDLLDQTLEINENLNNSARSLEKIERLELQSIDFNYHTAKELSLRNISLAINKGETIGIIGSTGSGKSTLVDLIMGLLKPSDGRYLINGIETPFEQMNNLQEFISHVPQQVFIADTSIKKNIALGFEECEIDENRVLEATKKSQLLGFIDSLESGLDSVVGENGSKLSGGQRQRLGIARALYGGGSILILDEATNALDMKTEKNIVEIIKNLGGDIITIIVAHNLETIKHCDRVLILENGSLVGQGNYSEISQSQVFKEVAGELFDKEK